MSNILNTDYRIFLIKFHYQGTNGQFIAPFKNLPEVLKTKDQHGIEFIKEFDPIKRTFKQVSKSDILELFKDTKDEEYINSHYYFD